MALQNGQQKPKVVATTEQHTGPIPTADEFARYREVLPDAPERILKVFEADSKHTREMQKSGLDAAVAFDKRSQYMAFTIIMGGVTGTLILAYLDKDVAAIMTGLATAALIFKGTFSPK